MNYTIPKGLTGKELYKFLTANKKLLIAQKKSAGKQSDAFSIGSSLYVDERGELVKEFKPIDDSITVIKALCIINTTYWFDSHKDVHIDGLWKKTLKETRDQYLCEQHEMTFRGIISDTIKAYTKIYKWRELGVDVDGTTEALVFESTIEKGRNPFMFEQYRQGRVKNHSVGMGYVFIELAINDEYYKEEFAVWNKYFEDIANKDEVEQNGYFWAVKEAKCIEGSAVVRGSNIITPTQSVEPVKELISTEEQPPHGTGKQPQTENTGIDWDKMADHLTF